MNRGGNVGILGVDINDNLTVVAVQTNIVRGESDLFADSTGDLLEVDLGFVDGNLTEQHNLKYVRYL